MTAIQIYQKELANMQYEIEICNNEIDSLEREIEHWKKQAKYDTTCDYKNCIEYAENSIARWKERQKPYLQQERILKRLIADLQIQHSNKKVA